MSYRNKEKLVEKKCELGRKKEKLKKSETEKKKKVEKSELEKKEKREERKVEKKSVTLDRKKKNTISK